ncbi:hypothetical protein ACFL6O_04315 [candidate division KSB1 bacterium]
MRTISYNVKRSVMGKKTVVLVKDKERQNEGLRCSLGLLLEDHVVSMIILNNEVKMTEEYHDNMMFIDEMGGSRYSNVSANIEKYGFKPITIDDVADLIKEKDVIIPF